MRASYSDMFTLPANCQSVFVQIRIALRDATFPLDQLFLSAVSVCVYLILGGVETWYATGFGHMGQLIRQIGNGQFSGCLGIPTCEIIFVVKGWAVAAVSLKVILRLY
ncbi:unnamed protein product [Toxocara canis]|uniref:Permease n=1 Tax=Toxocara canis TaxID=6265 RepID=A0A183U9V6_TOXCA|nr:unnamed protein product [Toxocara canis]